jgi:hypothetical protein
LLWGFDTTTLMKDAFGGKKIRHEKLRSIICT